MSGYFFLTISLLTGTAKGYCGKKISRYTEKLTDAISISSVRMGICALFGFILILFQHKLSICTALTTTDILCILWSAIANSAFVVLWLCCVHSDAYMLVEISLTLSVPIAVCGSMLIPALHETLRFRSIIGIIILVFASILMQGYNQKVKKKKLTPKEFAMLLALPFSSGLADLSQKYYIKTVMSADAAVFSFYSFLLSAAILVFSRLVQRQRSSISLSNIKNVLPYTVLMALFLYANIYFKTLAAAELSSAVLYPLIQCFSMILSFLMSVILFHEKATLHSFLGMLFAICGILVINLN